MSRFLPDTSCMVAALCSWHDHFARAARELERRLDAGENMIVACPALVETYAVLTRLPAPHRLSPTDTWTLLESSFVSQAAEMVALTAEAYHDLLHHAHEQRVAGGRTYDAVIAGCTLQGRVDVLVTFNERHFRDLVDPRIQVVVPSL